MKRTVMWLKRHQRKVDNHSIERCFDAIEVGFKAQAYSIESTIAPVPTNGIISMIRNCLAARNVVADIVHVTGDINYVMPFLRSKRRLLTVHDVGHVENPKHSAFKQWLLRLVWFKIPLLFCDTVICVSSQTLERLNDMVPPNNNQRRLVIPAAICERSDLPMRTNPFNTQKKVVLHIGTAPNKNLSRIWMACQQIDCHLAIVGHKTEELQRLESCSNLSYSLHTNVSDATLEQLLLHCHAVAFVSTHEGFGMPLIEAQVFGKPCIASAIEPLVSNSGGGAFLVDPIDAEEIRSALHRALTDRDAVDAIVEKGYENAKRFSGVEVARQHARVYDEEIRNI